MEALTLLVAIILSILAFMMRPVNGLLVFFASMIWYPSHTVSLGTIDFTVSRIVLMPLWANIILKSGKTREFRWCLMDTLMVLYVIGKMISLSTHLPFRIYAEREAGQLFEMIFPYFATRFIITSKTEMIHFLKYIVLISLPLPFLGLYESITGHNPFSIVGMGSAYVYRNYLYRAKLSFVHPIIYGLTFSGLSIIYLGLRKYFNWNLKKTLILFSVLALGVISSNSSAPLFAIVASMGFVSLYPFRRFMPIFILFFVSSLIFVEFYSNRHWYEVLTRFAGSGSTAYYRIGLINETFGGGMDGHWIFGYGYVGIGPGNFNELLGFNWYHKDMVNLYIAHLVRFGLVGLIPYLAMNMLYYKKLHLAYKRALSEADRWFTWCFAATLIGWNIAMMTVNALGTVGTMLYMLIGLCVNLPFLITQSETHDNRLRGQ